FMVDASIMRMHRYQVSEQRLRDRIMKKPEESESYVEPEIKRKVQQKRHCSTYQLSPLSPASKKCLTHLEVSEQHERCPKCGKEKENQTKCQSCGIVFHNDLQRNCRQAVTLTESTGPLLRTSIHQNSGGQKSQTTGLTAKKFYGNSVEKIPVDILVTCDASRHNYIQTNGKVILPGGKIPKITNPKERKTSVSDLNDPMMLFGRLGNPISTPLKRRKINTHGTLIHTLSLPHCQNFESVILNCRSIRVGTQFRLLVEPVIFSLESIKIHLDGPESDPVEIILNTSDLTKCEWCNVRKLPVVFLQATPAVYQRLSMQLQMNKEDKVWNNCKGLNRLTSLEEQYIILIFQTGLDPQANVVFESIITDIGIKNNVSNFFAKIPFEEANSRLVACTRSYEESIKGNCMSFESKIQLRSKQELQFFDEEEEAGESHTIFIGPVEKLIVYPPPPAKGGISVTNEDLHCLTEGEFLNDVIIDFYLKIQQKRHGRVKTWTRHVDIFEKDFIFVPLNEAENEESNNGESAYQEITDRTKNENGLQDECLNSVHHPDALSKIRLNYGDQSAEGGRMLEDELIDFSEDQDDPDDSSDDGLLADENYNSEIGQWHLKPTVCK
ncbi:hypothetical protein A6R68_23274, partial [Neotoma lepida]